MCVESRCIMSEWFCLKAAYLVGDGPAYVTFLWRYATWSAPLTSLEATTLLNRECILQATKICVGNGISMEEEYNPKPNKFKHFRTTSAPAE